MDNQQIQTKMSIEKGHKKDRRIQYTRNVLAQTLVQLLHTKPIEKISITEICKLADINRATFYLHYHSPYELLSEIQETFYASFKEDLELLLQKEGNNSLLLLLITKIRDNRAFCEVLFSEQGERSFQNKVLGVVREDLIRKWEKSQPKVMHKAHTSLVFKFITEGSTGMLQEWLAGGCQQSPEEIARLLELICQSGLNGCFPQVRH